jgi:hypothetical protein
VAKLEQQGEAAGQAGAHEAGPAIGARGAARRRFAKAGLGASGVLLTLASQPGMAATGVCTTPSGFLSGAMNSHTPGTSCSGRSPGYWKTRHEEWQSVAFTDGNANFNGVFPCGAATAGLKPHTLFDVVDPNIVDESTDNNRVAMHIVAALLNARAGFSPTLSEAKVKEIWAQYAINGYYTAMDGAKPWYGQQIVTYLTSTFVL